MGKLFALKSSDFDLGTHSGTGNKRGRLVFAAKGTSFTRAAEVDFLEQPTDITFSMGGLHCRKSTSTDVIARIASDLSITDGIVRIAGQLPSNNNGGNLAVGLGIRAQTNGNFIMGFASRTGTGVLQIYKRLAGAYTNIANVADTALIGQSGQLLELEFEFNGSTITLRDLTNNITATATDTGILTPGGWGPWIEGTGTAPMLHFDYAQRRSTSLNNSWISNALDTGVNETPLRFVGWRETLPAGTDVTIAVRAANTPDTGIFSADVTDNEGSVITGVEGRYWQARVTETRTTGSEEVEAFDLVLSEKNIVTGGGGEPAQSSYVGEPGKYIS